MDKLELTLELIKYLPRVHEEKTNEEMVKNLANDFNLLYSSLQLDDSEPKMN